MLFKGSDPNIFDEFNQNALIMAIKINSTDLVELMVKNCKISADAQDSEGKTAMHYLVNPLEYGSYENLIILNLIKDKINFNLPDKQGLLPIDYAS
jgi:ankyrin repeat protein